MKNTAFKFTIIISVYNIKSYILTALNSIINQSIGFIENVEVIIVDDFSDDGIIELITPLVLEYPNNIKVIKNLKKGVSAARNLGISHSSGKYLNFLDGDDYLSLDCLEKVNIFFEDNETELVSIPMYLFENETGNHILNEKFYSTRMIDITENPKEIQLSSSSSFIKKKTLIDNNLRFSENLTIGEDSLLITQVIKLHNRYGVISDAKYNYRKRKTKDSVIQNTYENKDYYFVFIESFIKVILSKYVESENCAYVKNVIMYNLQWHLRRKEKPNILTETENELFLKETIEIISHLDDSIIESAKFIGFHTKKYLIKKKYELRGKVTAIEETNEDIFLIQNNKVIEKFSNLKLNILSIEEVSRHEIKMIFDIGSLFDVNDFKISLAKNNHSTSFCEFDSRITKIMGKKIKVFRGYELRVKKIPRSGDLELFMEVIMNNKIKKIPFKKNNYYNNKDRNFSLKNIIILFQNDDATVRISKISFKTKLKKIIKVT